MGNRIGYARVSTKEQNIDSQLDQLAKAGCVKVITDTIGGTTKDRPGWNELMELARSRCVGHTIVVSGAGCSSIHLRRIKIRKQQSGKKGREGDPHLSLWRIRNQ